MNCSQLFIGVEKQLSEGSSETFSIRLLPSASPDAKKVRGVLGSKYIYYLAPHTGCGCGWDYLEVDAPSDELSKQSGEALGQFLSSIEQMQKGSKLYSACIESLGASPISETPISAAEFMGGILQLRIGYSSPGAKVFVLGT